MGSVMVKRCFVVLMIFSVLFLGIMILTVQHGGYIRVGKFTITVTSLSDYFAYLSPSVKNGSVPVLIFTYMRSGSTLTGSILQQHPSNFYVFEPLRFIDDDINNGNRIIFLNETTRTVRKHQRIRLHAEMIYRWLTCDFRYVNIRDLTSLFLGSFSWKALDYYRCMRHNNGTITAVSDCIHLLVKPCITSELRIAKTIRMHMQSVALLLEWMPNLKVIYLIRDPRGKLSSQINAYHKEWSNVIDLSKETCNQMMSDMRAASHLKYQYPDRIRVLVYEKLATLPVETSSKIFEFLNLNFTADIVQSVRDMTSGPPGRRSRCTFCSKKGNSRSIAYKWRTQSNLLYLEMIDKRCSDVYETAGYVRFKNIKDIRNLNKPILQSAEFINDAL